MFKAILIFISECLYNIADKASYYDNVPMLLIYVKFMNLHIWMEDYFNLPKTWEE